MALLANAAANLNDGSTAKSLCDYLAARVADGGVRKLKADHSIVRSYGESLTVEVAALASMALMKQGDAYFTEVLTLQDYILDKRSYGGFGSTQGTVMALKSIIMYAGIVNVSPSEGLVKLFVNNKEIARHAFSGDDKRLVLDSLGSHLSSGVQHVDIRFEGLSNPVSFTTNAACRQEVPASSEACKVRLQTQLAAIQCAINDVVRLSTVVSNKTDKGLPMTVAMVGIPGGLSAQLWQLKKLQEEQVVDFYEVFDNYVVFYFREMAPNARHTIHLDLKADLPGRYSSPAGCAYLYYSNEHKDWQKAGDLTIKRQ